MSSFWNFVTQMVAGTLARAEDVNTNLSGIDTGFDLVETEINKTIQITNAAGVTDVPLNATARANKLLSFDVNGDIAATTIMGDWKGAHADAAGTDYQIRDVVRDDAGALQLGSLYICIATHTSTGSLLTDTANWELLVDSTSLTTFGGLLPASYLRADDPDTLSVNSASDALTINNAGAGAALRADNAVEVVTSINAQAVSVVHNGLTSGPGVDLGNFSAAATGSVVQVNQASSSATAISLYVIQTGAGDAVRVNVTHADAHGAYITSNVASRSEPLVEIVNDNATGSGAGLRIQQDQGGPAIDLTSQGTIKFPATATPNADVHTLDDYEEGTFTPTLQDSTGSDAEGQTHLNQFGYYTKIGNMVFIQGRLQVNSLGSLTGGDQARVANLPFTADGSNTFGGGVTITNADSLAISAGEVVVGAIPPGTNYMVLELWDATTGTTNMSVTEFSAAGLIDFFGMYRST